jgi:hypothetical protein
MINQSKLKITAQILFFALLFPLGANASAIHETTAATTTGAPSSISDVHYGKSAWLYTKRDSTGYAQVYYQYLDQLC